MTEEVDGNSLGYYRDFRAGRFWGMGGFYALYADGKFVLAWNPNMDDGMRQVLGKIYSGKRIAYRIERVPTNISISP